jgi:transcriptional regulator with XRE-family HTH domain
MTWEQIVAANVRRIRKERGLTQEQLALQAEIAMRYIGMIERAETSATVGMLGKLAEALGVGPEAFFNKAGG